ncbi:hypothetical protein FR483_n039L [Paramecium bursaria Chlorella virus FR483]|uniref:Uncharacterized protein n039L n=1 Tax=Paramecium bursaria Chlorella virus FR483 TaxID=399781 RepID=A7J693_PBCVF|nr:hypothetical protein FR483_n039L [Paramecium bursaria Chlorella virus FR483]ABT15324.1 hypothetical protein FR483_n039L [Paramecium bursaria Chlorella virus FR483]
MGMVWMIGESILSTYGTFTTLRFSWCSRSICCSVITNTRAPRASTSSMFDFSLSRQLWSARDTTTGTGLLRRARGPCLSSPAEIPSAWM